MELGAVYPQIELRGDPDAVRTIGQAVEGFGYDHLLAYDHVLGAVHEGRSPALGALPEKWGRLQEVLREEGRSLDGFGAEATIGSREGVEDVAARIRRWEALGGTHASVISMGLGLDSAQAHVDHFGRVAAAMGRS